MLRQRRIKSRGLSEISFFVNCFYSSRNMNHIKHTIEGALVSLSNPQRLIPHLLPDRVVLALIMGLAILAWADAKQVLPSLEFTVRAFTGILPFLLAAVFLAAASRATSADSLIAAAFKGRPTRAIVMAAAAGALSPFCSCGVIPVIAALLRSRVPLAPVMAFWIASPVMDPEMFILTAAGISMEFALAKIAATLAMGVLAGYAIHAFQQIESFATPLRDAAGSGCSTALRREDVQWRFWRSSERRELFAKEASSTSVFLGKWLLLAFFIESLMVAYVAPEWIGRLFGSGQWYEIPLAALVGIPAYLNGYAAIPLISGLMDMGMNPGAALAFVIAGAVSSIPAAMAVAVLVKRRVFIAYLALGFAGSILTGVAYMLITTF